MSATDVLRRMLDERGVEWESKDVEGISGFHDTRWNAYDVRWCYVEFVGNNYTKLVPSSEFHCTPEQAIAATLVNSRAERTCKNVDDHKTVWFICSVCGYQQKLSHTRSYCPNCGARVVE